MDYETGKALETINEKLDLLLQKAYPEEFTRQNEEEKKKLEPAPRRR